MSAVLITKGSKEHKVPEKRNEEITPFCARNERAKDEQDGLEARKKTRERKRRESSSISFKVIVLYSASAVEERLRRSCPGKKTENGPHFHSMTGTHYGYGNPFYSQKAWNNNILRNTVKK